MKLTVTIERDNGDNVLQVNFNPLGHTCVWTFEPGSELIMDDGKLLSQIIIENVFKEIKPLPTSAG